LDRGEKKNTRFKENKETKYEYIFLKETEILEVIYVLPAWLKSGRNPEDQDVWCITLEEVLQRTV